MKRKVIKQGHNTLTVTLPRKWADKFNVKGGDEIEIEERGSSLILGSEKGICLDKVEIDVTGLDRSSIMFYIRSVYRRGFDEIVIRFNEPYAYHHRVEQKKKVVSIIHQEVNRLVGVELIEQKNDFCVIKDVSGDSFKDFDTILRKVFLLISDALSDITIGAKESETVLIEEIEEKHDTITKFISYCLRLLNKKGYVDSRKTIFLYTIIESLDMITDIVKYAARDLLAYNKKLKKETLDILDSIKTSFTTFYELFYKFDLKKFSKLNEIRDSVLKKIDVLPKKIPETELVLVTDMEHILEIIREISGTRMGLEY
ncbi:AbrB/MazE/SpoVT family DNA-binding domain-containing protein [Candidatus Woesearchaeota archaeon]|nr:AbrB/MazE/SpoVT family DNA-binding domain-containing protein [Candidatus Woesearchaeota archaeon]